MVVERHPSSQLDAKRREQTPQALARLVVVCLFVGLWFVLWSAHIPMPVPFLIVLLAEVLFFLVYWRTVFLLPSVRAVGLAQYGMLAAEIVFHTTMVYFLGGISWLGAFAYVFGLIFANTFLDLRRGLLYTSGAALAFSALVLLEATGAIPHYVYLEQGPMRYTDARLVATTIIAGFGVFFSIYLWVYWVGHQLRQERDAARRAQDDLLQARAELQQANAELESRVKARTVALERANAALRESEERLRTVVTNAPVVLFAIDCEGVFTLSEGKALESLGLKPGEVVGRSIFDVYRDVPQIVEHARRALAGEAFTATVDVAGREFEAHYTPVRDHDGEMSGGIGVAMDVTQRKRMEEALRESETKFRTTAETITASVFILQEEKIRYANPAMETMSGYTRDELLGMRIRDLIHPDSRDLTKQLGPVPGRGKEVPQRYEVKILSKNGEEKWVDFAGSVFEFEDEPAVLGTAFDITDRKRAEEALRESESKFRTMAETIAAAAFIFQGTKIRYVNSAAEAMTGYSREEMLTMDFWDVIHPDFQELARERGQARQRSEQVPQGYEVKLLAKAGQECWVDFTAGTVEYQGKPAVLGTAFDITERKRAEEALRRSEEFLAKAQEVARIGSWDHDMVTGRIRCSDQLLGMYGIKREEFDGALDTILPAIHPDDRQKVVAGNAAAYTENRAEPIEFRIVAPDGTERVAWAEVELVFDDAGKAIRMVGTVQDITERKRAEETLRESEEKYRGIFENVQDIYYQTDAQGIITEISPSVERWGYTREELIGTQVLDVYEDPEERSALLQALVERGEVLDFEVHLKAGDGRVVDTSVSSHFLRGSVGTPIGVEGTLRDISERKRMEEALREQVRRDPLTGVLNHAAIVEELRNLLSSGTDGASHAVAMVDVDGLKAVNDTYGHQIGDAVLTTVASTLSRDSAIVGRYGGDEFVAVLPGADRASAERFRSDALEVMESAKVIDPETGASVPVVASIGLAIYPEDADTIADLIRLADSAMYAARRQRLAGATDLTTTGPLGGDRAAEMVGQIVPLLTSPGRLEDKLRLVAQSLSVGAGYDAVDFSLFAPEPGPPLVCSTFGRGPKELLDAWAQEQRNSSPEPHPLRLLFEHTPRPVILDDPWNSELLEEPQRAILRTADVKSVLVAPMIWQNQVVGSLGVASRREGAFTPRDAQFLTAVATQVTAIARMATLLDELQLASTRLLGAQDETVMLLAAAAEAHDHTTGLHLQSVRALSEALAWELGYSEDKAKELGLAAVLHDIGKIRVPDSVLTSTGQLRDEEWELMRRHTIWGAEFLAGHPGYELATTIARSHHERWDGSGYPDGLAGEAIPEAATIVAVADSFDAMVNDRPYRKRRSGLQAVREISACSGKQFDPKVVDALLRLHKRKALRPASPQSSRRAA